MSFNPGNAVAWSEIPVTDMEKSIVYYSTVFDYDLSLNTDGPNPIAILPNKDNNSVSGHLYAGKPPSTGHGPTLHLAIADKLEDAMQRCTKAGGQVVSPPIEIPNGRFAYTRDLDGNSIGLFEAAS
jgi:predicted enzyme related to lactoylglutathione lyase